MRNIVASILGELDGENALELPKKERKERKLSEEKKEKYEKQSGQYFCKLDENPRQRRRERKGGTQQNQLSSNLSTVSISALLREMSRFLTHKGPFMSETWHKVRF